jgi:hypothetical protein
MHQPPAPVFSRQDALAFGWTDSALRRATRSGRIERVRRGHFASAGPGDDPIIAAIAAARACTGSVVSHRSAALLHGLPMLTPVPFRPDLTVLPKATGDTTGALVHRAAFLPQDVTVIDGTPATTVARTVVDLARTMSIQAAVAALDHALHESLVAPPALADVLERCRRWPGIRRARMILELGDPRAESPLESASRIALARKAVRDPDLQPTIYRGATFIARVDFYWDHAGVVGEADGRMKYTDRADLVEEKLRQERLEDAGLVVVRWGWDDVRRPAALARRIERAFERGARRDASGFPRQWSVRSAESDHWRGDVAG